jgi:hypothetical protein
MSDPVHLAQIIDKYRSNCNFYVKLDFAGIGFFVTLMTLLKFDEEKVAFFASQLTFWISVWSVLAVAGLLLDYLMLEDWRKAMLGHSDEKIIRRWSRVAFIQTLLHCTVVLALLGSATGVIQSIAEHVQ